MLNAVKQNVVLFVIRIINRTNTQTASGENVELLVLNLEVQLSPDLQNFVSICSAVSEIKNRDGWKKEWKMARNKERKNKREKLKKIREERSKNSKGRM